MRELGIPLLAFGGEAEPDAELTALSTAPSGAVAEAFEYLRQVGRGRQHREPAALRRGYSPPRGLRLRAPRAVPELGVYHPGFRDGSALEDLLALHDPPVRRSV